MVNTNTKTSPAALVAIADAANQTGDRDLEATAKRKLLEQHGIKLSFSRRKKVAKQ